MQNVGRDPAGTRPISILAPIQPSREVMICSIVREIGAYELMPVRTEGIATGVILGNMLE